MWVGIRNDLGCFQSLDDVSQRLRRGRRKMCHRVPLLGSGKPATSATVAAQTSRILKRVQLLEWELHNFCDHNSLRIADQWQHITAKNHHLIQLRPPRNDELRDPNPLILEKCVGDLAWRPQ